MAIFSVCSIPFLILGFALFLNHNGYFCRCHSVSHSNLTFHWGYEDNITSEYWCSMFPLCCGSQQSPIDIISTDLYAYDYSIPQSYFGLYMANATDEPVSVIVVNTGRTAEFRVHNDLAASMIVGGGCYGNELYSLVAFHFHWGSENDLGSEHTFDGRHFPFEMHLLHRNIKYANFEEAKKEADGLAVVAVFFELVYEDDQNADPTPEIFETFAEQLPHVKYAGWKREFFVDNFQGLLPSNLNNYYCYFGSLTTPTCNEAVTWTLLSNPIRINSELLLRLRSLQQTEEPSDDGEDWPLVDNFRPVQPLNSRVVQFYSYGTNYGQN